MAKQANMGNAVIDRVNLPAIVWPDRTCVRGCAIHAASTCKGAAMNHDTFWLTAIDRSQLYVNQWLPAGPVKAVILLAHGMAEHSGRYARLAERFCEKSYGVYAPDLRGHGRTAESGTLGH